jgi:hypothetical protein
MVCSRVDRSGNVSTVGQRQFTYDTSLPDTLIQLPSASAYKNLSTISGSASDNVGLSKVEIRIKDTKLDKYWVNPEDDWDDGVPFPLDSEDAWFTVITTVTPQYEIWYATFNRWTNGYTYEINARAFDGAMRYDTEYSTRSFTYDEEEPYMTVTSPADGTYMKEFTGITGNSGDNPTGGGLSNAGVDVGQRRIAIRSNYTMGFWTGVTFTNPGPSPKVVNGEPWNMVSPPPESSLLNGTSYYMTTYCPDLAGNVLDWYNVYSSTFVYDSSALISVINLPEYASNPGKAYAQLETISGTAEDPEPEADKPLNAGIKNVELTIYNVTDDEHWTQSGWGAQITTFTAVYYPGSKIWTSTDVADSDWEQGHRYRIKVWATDNTLPFPGNIEQVEERYFVYESSAPGSLFVNIIDDQKYSSLSSISGTAVDYPISGGGIYNAGLKKIEISIKREEATPYYWTGSSWTTNVHRSTNSITGASDNWQFVTGSPAGWILPAWQSGNRYNVSILRSWKLHNR